MGWDYVYRERNYLLLTCNAWDGANPHVYLDYTMIIKCVLDNLPVAESGVGWANRATRARLAGTEDGPSLTYDDAHAGFLCMTLLRFRCCLLSCLPVCLDCLGWLFALSSLPILPVRFVDSVMFWQMIMPLWLSPFDYTVCNVQYVSCTSYDTQYILFHQTKYTVNFLQILLCSLLVYPLLLYSVTNLS